MQDTDPQSRGGDTGNGEGTAAGQLANRAGVGSRQQPPPTCLRHPRTLPQRAGSSFTEQTGLLYWEPFTNPPDLLQNSKPGQLSLGAVWGKTRTKHGRQERREKEGGEADWRQVSVPQGRSLPFQASPPTLPELSPPPGAGSEECPSWGILQATPLSHSLQPPFPSTPGTAVGFHRGSLLPSRDGRGGLSGSRIAVGPPRAGCCRGKPGDSAGRRAPSPVLRGRPS